MNVRHVILALLASTSLACNLSDPNAPLDSRPVQGQPCAEAGQTFGNLECDGETWQSDGPRPTEEMGTPAKDMGMDADDMSAPGSDMDAPIDEEMCTLQSDDDLCVQASATCGELQITDACGTERTIASCGECATDESCVTNACACDAVVCDQISCGVTSNTCGNETTCGCGDGSICDAGVCAAQLTITPPDPTLTHGSFGLAVSLRGNFLAVGAPEFDEDMARSRSRGAVFLYRHDPTTLEWSLVTRIDSPDACNNCRFGAALDFDATQDMLVIGEPGDAKVHIYTVDAQAGMLALTNTLESPDPVTFEPDRFGAAVASHDPYLAIGAPDSSGSGFIRQLGKAFLYRRQGQEWNQVDLPGNYSLRADHTHLGWAIDLDGDRLLVGAPGSHNPNQKGRAYLLERNGQSWELAENGEFNPNESGAQDLFGNAVALGTSELFVGMADANITGPSDDGAVFRYYGDMLEYELLDNTFHMPQENDSWGYSLATYGDWLVAGIAGVDVPLDNTPTRGMRSGVAIYRKGTDASWVGQRLFVPENNAELHAGKSVAISESFIAIGAPGRDDDASNDRVFLLTHP